MWRALLLLSVATACASASSNSPCPGLSAAPHLVDLTHTLSPRFPFIPYKGKTFPFRMTSIADLHTEGVAANRWELTEHVGTHVDAPNHFAAGGAAIEQIPLRELIVPAVVVDIRQKATRTPDALLDVADLRAWEERHGRMPAGAGVFLLSGWAERASVPGAFVNLDEQSVMHFPGFTLEAVEFLIAERHVRGLGTDTLSIDPGLDRKYLGHRRLFEAGGWAAECVANLDQLPPVGASIFLAVTKVEGATGAPARIVAFW